MVSTPVTVEPQEDRSVDRPRKRSRRAFFSLGLLGGAAAIGGGVNEFADRDEAGGVTAGEGGRLRLGEIPIARADRLPASAADFGARGDGTTDDTAALQRAIDLLERDGGGSLFLPAGTYRTSRPLAVRGDSVRFVGSGRGATAIRNADSDVVRFGAPGSTAKFISFEALTLDARGGGHCLASGGRGLEQSEFRDVTLRQADGGRSILHWVDGGVFVDNLFTHSLLEHVSGSTVPAFNLVSSRGEINTNTWQRCRCNFGGTHFFHLESLAAQSYLYDNAFRDITAEVVRGGFARLLSTYSTTFENVANWDMDAAGPSTGDWILVGRKPGRPASVMTRIVGGGRRAGRLGPRLNDIRLERDGAELTRISHVGTPTREGYHIDLGANRTTQVLEVQNPVLLNVPAAVAPAAPAGASP